MARAVKEGFTYFPLDTDSFENRKMRRLLLSQGCQAYAVWVVTMQMIFGEKGYYLHLDDDMCFDIGDKVAVSEGAVKEILTTCIQVDLFNKQMFDKFGILTSKGIQKQFEEMVKVTKRKTTIDPKYKINPEEMTVGRNKLGRNDSLSAIYSEETPIYSEEMQQSKVKESKVNKNKIKTDNTNSISNQDNTQGLFSESVNQKAQSVVEVVNYYRENAEVFGALTRPLYNELVSWCEVLSPELTKKALEIAVKNNKKYAYVEGILKNWKAKGFKTLYEVDQEESRFQQQKQQRHYGKSKRQEVIPSYMLNSQPSRPPQADEDEVISMEALAEQLRELSNPKGADDGRN